MFIVNKRNHVKSTQQTRTKTYEGNEVEGNPPQQSSTRRRGRPRQAVTLIEDGLANQTGQPDQRRIDNSDSEQNLPQQPHNRQSRRNSTSALINNTVVNRLEQLEEPRNNNDLDPIVRTSPLQLPARLRSQRHRILSISSDDDSVQILSDISEQVRTNLGEESQINVSVERSDDEYNEGLPDNLERELAYDEEQQNGSSFDMRQLDVVNSSSDAGYNTLTAIEAQEQDFQDNMQIIQEPTNTTSDASQSTNFDAYNENFNDLSANNQIRNPSFPDPGTIQVTETVNVSIANNGPAGEYFSDEIQDVAATVRSARSRFLDRLVMSEHSTALFTEFDRRLITENSITENIDENIPTTESALPTAVTLDEMRNARLPHFEQCQVIGCETKWGVRKWDCGHRFCVPRIRQFLTRFCPQCREPIGNYLPPEFMGGEAWESEEANQIDDEFYDQVVEERLNLEREAMSTYIL
uniref:RING-type domain-containing protein n=1 Tax=Trichogramma kaykai TaxID=54128 RepID=A0ABD2W446_9HYME